MPSLLTDSNGCLRLLPLTKNIPLHLCLTDCNFSLLTNPVDFSAWFSCYKSVHWSHTWTQKGRGYSVAVTHVSKKGRLPMLQCYWKLISLGNRASAMFYCSEEGLGCTPTVLLQHSKEGWGSVSEKLCCFAAQAQLLAFCSSCFISL